MRALTPDERATRVAAIHAPYQQAVANELARRDRQSQASVLVSLHSFTSAMTDETSRPWHVGVLHHGGDPSFVKDPLAALRRETGPTVGNNGRYKLDRIAYTVPHHAYSTR